ncbi:MAG TPA: PIG-L family deacetylase, partial [Actinomycetota bacterium]
MKRPSAPSPPRVPLALTASLLAILASGLPPAGARSPSGTEPASGYVAPPAVKINVMGEWAHPDDDTSIIGPCGVWHDLYDIKCGIIMVTRGEGGGNAVGPEKGPALGLRRENEDRAAHYRSGTVDVFNIDAVDFFYNQSAPLTQLMWNHEESLRRITRIIRTTQPDIYIGFTPSLASGHGNHQQAGRFIWEGVLAAADPEMFPEQLTGPNALSTWQVKKVFSGGSSAGNGGTVASAHCTTGFTPSGLETVSGVWTGYDSPYLWPVGNTHGGVPGTPKTWAEVASEGGAAYPTQSRSMWVAQSPPGCPRYGMSQSFVPFQRNGATVGGVEYAGRDDAILYGATLPDPGGLPLGTLEYLTFSSFFNVAGDPFDVTLHVRSGSGTLAGGSATLTVPAGWSVDAATEPIGPVSDETESTVTFSVTPAAGAGPGLNKIAAMLTSGQATGYTDGV